MRVFYKECRFIVLQFGEGMYIRMIQGDNLVGKFIELFIIICKELGLVKGRVIWVSVYILVNC